MSFKQSLKWVWKDFKNLLRGKDQRHIRGRRERPDYNNIPLSSPFKKDILDKSLKNRASLRKNLMKDEEAEHRVKFPWLYGRMRSYQKGAMWEFDPLLCRSIGEEMPLVEGLIDALTMDVAKTPWQISEIEDPTEMHKRIEKSAFDRRRKQKAEGERVEQMEELLRNPDPDHDWNDIIDITLPEWTIVGACNLVKEFYKSDNVFNSEGEYQYEDADMGEHPIPKYLRPSVDPITFTKDFDKRGLLKNFWQFARPLGEGSIADLDPIKFSPHEVIWSDFKKRSWRRYGIPPVLEVLDILELYDLTIEQERVYFSKGSIPSGVLKMENWDRKEAKDFWNTVKEETKGQPHRFIPIGGKEGDIDFIKFGYNFKDLQFLERKKDYRKEIAVAFRVSESFLGTKPEDVNRATSETEEKITEESTIAYYLRKYERMLNRYLIQPHLGKNYMFEFIPSTTEEARASVSQRVRAEYDAGLITQNEARRPLGYDEVEDGDEFKEPSEDREDELPLPMSQDIGKPFGPWEDFDDCVSEMMEQEGYDEETAQAVCGRLQEELKDRESNNTSKEEPLRETEDWHDYGFGPKEIEEMAEKIKEPLEEVWEKILNDDKILEAIERWTTNESEREEKSMSLIGSRLKEIYTATRMVDAIREVVQNGTDEVIETNAGKAASMVGVEVDPTEIASRIRERDPSFADREAQRMTEEIQNTVAEGWEEGEGVQEIVENLKEDSNMVDNYAEKVARTEMTIASEDARTETADYLDDTLDEQIVVEWSAVGDNRTRESHEELDGKWRYTSEYFPMNDDNNKTHLCKQPADPNLPAGLSIQCRCTTMIRTREEVKDEDHVGVTS